MGSDPLTSTGSDPLKLIVGLGNPGRDYEHTRHNVGFKVVEELARRHRVDLRGSGEVEGADGEDSRTSAMACLLAEPTTFMNLSGLRGARARVVSQGRRRRTCWSSSTTRICRSAGCARRPRGSAGGHNGLKSIIEELGTNEFRDCGSASDGQDGRAEEPRARPLRADEKPADRRGGEAGGGCGRSVRERQHRDGHEPFNAASPAARKIRHNA